jgi:hypothetical protein
MVEGLVAMRLDKYKGSGAELVFGEGSFVGPKTIEVRLKNGGVRTLQGDRVFLNLGTHAAIPDIPGPSRGETAHARRGARTRSPSGTSDCPGRRVCPIFMSVVYCLKAAVKSGELPAMADCKELAHFLYSFLQGAILQAKVERSPLPLKRFIKIAFSTILR